MIERLARDVHPAEVALPDGKVVTGARVFVTTTRLLAYVAGADRRISRVVDMELTVPGAVAPDRSSLQGGQIECPVAGGSAWINRGAGCGCASPLKGLAPPVGWTG